MSSTSSSSAGMNPSTEAIISATEKTSIDPVAPRRHVDFLDLAQELRDMVYKYHVTIDGGYILNPKTWKLRPNQGSDDAGRSEHPFGLQLTCKSIAREMTGLALKHNLVTFTTIDTARELAFQWETLVNMNLQLCKRLLETAARKELGGRMPDSFKETMSHYCDNYMGLRDHISDLFTPRARNEEARDAYWIGSHNELWENRYITPSERLSFAKFVVQQPEFYPFFAHVPNSVLELDLHHQPWRIPSEEEVKTLFNLLLPFIALVVKSAAQIPSIWEHHLDPPNRLKYRFSAAAAAIKFLDSLKPSYRAHLRHILLDEDCESVAHPERHGRGLVRFCDENPLLRIERKLGIWTALLPQKLRADPEYYVDSGRASKWASGHGPLGQDEFSFAFRHWYYLGNYRFFTTAYSVRNNVTGHAEEHQIFGSEDILQMVALWVGEVLDLPSSITLMLDGGPIPEHTAEVFDAHVVRSAVWQEAWERRVGWVPLPSVHARWLEKGEEATFEYFGCFPCVVFDDFPHMIKDILDGTSPNVRLNFPTKGRNSGFIDQEVEQLLYEHRDLDPMGEWSTIWEARSPWSIEPELPLAANWAEIWEGDLLPKTEQNGGPYVWEEWMDPNYLCEWMEEITPSGYIMKDDW